MGDLKTGGILSLFQDRRSSLQGASLMEEKQAELKDLLQATTSSTGYWRSSSLRKKTSYLALYFCFSLALTLHNKQTMVKFPYPFALTGIHAACNCIGICTLWINGSFRPMRLEWKDAVQVVMFSVLYSVNIAVSNLSLNLVTVPVHQVARSLTPLIVVCLSFIFLKRRFVPKVYYSLTVVTCGVVLATFGDYSVSAAGLILTFMGAFLAAVKTIVTSSFLKSAAKLGPLDLLFYMSPPACIHMIILSAYTGEAKVIVTKVLSVRGDHNLWLWVFSNGALAFGLNVVSFGASKTTGAVAISVAANVKQVLTIILATILFNLNVSFSNSVGIAITLLGGAWYAHVEYDLKKNVPGHVSPPTTPSISCSNNFESFIENKLARAAHDLV